MVFSCFFSPYLLFAALNTFQDSTVRSKDGSKIVGTRVVAPSQLVSPFPVQRDLAPPPPSASPSAPPSAPPSAAVPFRSTLLKINTLLDEEEDDNEEEDEKDEAPPPIPVRGIKSKKKASETPPPLPLRRNTIKKKTTSASKKKQKNKLLSPSVRRAQRKYSSGIGSGSGSDKKIKKIKKTNSFSKTSVLAAVTEKGAKTEERTSTSPRSNFEKIAPGSPVQKRNHELLASSFSRSATKAKKKTTKRTTTTGATLSKKKNGPGKSTKAANDSLLKYYQRMNMAKKTTNQNYSKF
jgi:hypothetical protein